MLLTKPCPTPATTGNLLSGIFGKPLLNPILYRQIVGALQYLTHTRPDIAFIVNKLSQFIQVSTDQHLKAVKRVLRYLKGTSEVGLHIKPCEKLTITSFSDADWACTREDRKTTTGHCVFLGDTLVS